MYEQVLYGIYATLTEDRVLLFGYTGAPLFQRGRQPGEQREDKLAVCHTAVGRVEWAAAQQCQWTKMYSKAVCSR